MISEAIDLSSKVKESDKSNEKGYEIALGSGPGSKSVRMYSDGGGITWNVSVLREAVARNHLTAEVR